ncbi:chorismate synthase [Thermococcus prieurii]
MRGRLLSFTLFGESHGKAVGVLVEGLPPGIEVKIEEMKVELGRRKGIPRFSTKRRESDEPVILSGVFNGFTTGTPVAVMVWNRDVDSSYYEEIRNTPRPGHADYPAKLKFFGYNDYRGGGHFSGRLTVGTVIAGYFAKKLLERYNVRIRAYLRRVGSVECPSFEPEELLASTNPYCPDEDAFERMLHEMEDARKKGDSVGGVVEAVAVNVPPGLGGPWEEDIEADLASALFRIPAVKGVEFGLGFKFAEMRGSEANDPFVIRDGKVVTETNNHGGVLGGITTGMPLVARIAFKPTPSIYLPQRTVDLDRMDEVELRLRGRFDSCIVPKALPVVEAVIAFVLADHLLRRKAWEEVEKAQ